MSSEENNSSNKNNFDPNIMMNMDKDKLFETFMMFQNFIQNMNTTNSNMQTPQQSESCGQLNGTIIPTNVSNTVNDVNEEVNIKFEASNTNRESNNLTIIPFSKINSDNENKMPLNKQNVKLEEPKIITPIEKEIIIDNEIKVIEKQFAPIEKAYISNSPNNVKDKSPSLRTSDIKLSLNKAKINFNKEKETLNNLPGSNNNNMKWDDSTIGGDTKPTIPNTNTNNNFDDVPIKSTGVNFIELLERNLAMDNPMTDIIDKDIIIKKVSRQRFKKVVNVSKPTETKKYKYYADNFENKDKEDKEIVETSNNINEKESKYTKKNQNSKLKNKADVKDTPPDNKDKLKIKTIFQNIPSKKEDNTSTNHSNSNYSSTNNIKEGNTKSIGRPKKPAALKNIPSSTNMFLLEKHNTITGSMNNSNLGENSLKKIKTTLMNNSKKESAKWVDTNFKELESEDKLEVEEVRRSNTSKPAKTASKSPIKNEEKKTKIEYYNNNLDFAKESTSITKKSNTFSIGFTGGQLNSNKSKKEEELYLQNSSNEEYEEEEISTVMYNNIDAEFLTNINPATVDAKHKDNKAGLLSTNNLTSEGKDILNGKLKELNYEIQKLKGENEKVTKLKVEYEKLTRKLGQDIKDLNEKKEQEFFELELVKEEEMKRMQKERKAHERNLKAIQNVLPSRKEKDEIESLKQHITKLNEEYKIKENTNKLIIDRLKKQLEEASLKVTDLSKVNANTSNSNNFNTNLNVNLGNLNNFGTKKNQNTEEKNIRKEKSKNKIIKKEVEVVKKEVDLEREIYKKNIILTKPESINKNNILNPNTNNSNYIEDDNDTYDLTYLEKYHPKNNTNKLVKSEKTSDGKLIRIFENDKREVLFPSGVRKEIHPDGYQLVYFTNKDIKQIYPNGKSVYFFSDAKTVQTAFPDNLQVFKFENGQIEKHYPDGSKQISFPDGSLRYILQDGYEETYYPDGTSHKGADSSPNIKSKKK